MNKLCRFKSNADLGFPRLIAHRGLSWAMPENTIPAFAAAIALGADEIEIDLWVTKDDELVVCHDHTVDRTSNGHGEIADLTWPEIQALDAGAWMGEAWQNIRFSSFEEVLAYFAQAVIFNIHIKGASDNGHAFKKKHMEKVAATIRKYNCEDWCYIAGDRDILELAVEVDEGIERCSLCGCFDYTIVDEAIRYRCKKVQLVKPYYTAEMIEKAHRHGITCNLFWADDPSEAQGFFAQGIDAILTNRLNLLTDMKLGGDRT